MNNTRRRGRSAPADDPSPTAPPEQPAADASPTLPPAAKPLRLEYRSPAELAENPRNWRTHPPEQIAALTDVIAEVGWAGVCLYNETTGRLLDGHARRKVAIDQGAAEVPVLIGSWTEEQEKLILATFDPIGGAAGVDEEKLKELQAQIQTDSAVIQALLAKTALDAGVNPLEEGEPEGGGEPSPKMVERFDILIVCETEQRQAELLEKFAAEGIECRSLIS